MRFSGCAKSLVLFSVVGLSLVGGQAHAWDVNCEVDSFTDEESCVIRNHDVDSGLLTILSMTDDDIFGLVTGKEGVLFRDTFLVRIDDNDAMDLEEAARLVSSGSGRVAALLYEETVEDLVTQMREGREINVRLSEFRGGYVEASIGLEGFASAWREFNESDPEAAFDF